MRLGSWPCRSSTLRSTSDQTSARIDDADLADASDHADRNGLVERMTATAAWRRQAPSLRAQGRGGRAGIELIRVIRVVRAICDHYGLKAAAAHAPSVSILSGARPKAANT